MSTGRLVERRALLAVLGRPRLWGPAATLVVRLAPAGWWRRWPPLPNPSPAYASYRLHTAHGADERPLEASELVEFLAWCRRMETLSR